MSKAKIITAVVSLAVVGAAYYKGRQLKAKIIEAMKEMEAKAEEAPVVETAKEVKAEDAEVDTLNASSAV